MMYMIICVLSSKTLFHFLLFHTYILRFFRYSYVIIEIILNHITTRMGLDLRYICPGKRISFTVIFKCIIKARGAFTRQVLAGAERSRGELFFKFRF